MVPAEQEQVVLQQEQEQVALQQEREQVVLQQEQVAPQHRELLGVAHRLALTV